jgi:hypothetical protein
MESKLTTYKNGDKVWKLPNGKRHREDGPAVELIYGMKYWYLNDIQYGEKEYKYKMRSIKLKLLLH